MKMGGNSEKVNLGHIIEDVVHKHWKSIKAVVANRWFVDHWWFVRSERLVTAVLKSF